VCFGVLLPVTHNFVFAVLRNINWPIVIKLNGSPITLKQWKFPLSLKQVKGKQEKMSVTVNVMCAHISYKFFLLVWNMS
jgi:hypothetical protein